MQSRTVRDQEARDERATDRRKLKHAGVLAASALTVLGTGGVAAANPPETSESASEPAAAAPEPAAPAPEPAAPAPEPAAPAPQPAAPAPQPAAPAPQPAAPAPEPAASAPEPAAPAPAQPPAPRPQASTQADETIPPPSNETGVAAGSSSQTHTAVGVEPGAAVEERGGQKADREIRLKVRGGLQGKSEDLAVVTVPPLLERALQSRARSTWAGGERFEEDACWLLNSGNGGASFQVGAEDREDSKHKVGSESEGKGEHESEGAQAKVESESETEGNAKDGSETEGKVESESEGKAKLESEAEGKANLESEAEGKAKLESEAEGKAKLGSEAEGEANRESESEGNGVSGPETQPVLSAPQQVPASAERGAVDEGAALPVQGGSPEQAPGGGTQQAVLRGEETGAGVPAGQNAASEDQRAVESTSADTLPFTGAPVALVALLGFAALLSGVGIRRRLS